jgi:copper(I)-binding protein
MLRPVLSMCLILAGIGSPLIGHADTAPPSGLILVASDGVSASDAWARASPGAATTSAAYVMLMGGSQADALVGASTPIAATAEVHQSVSDQGVMKMRPVTSLPIPAGGMVMLQPGSFHLMLMGLTRPLIAGQSFPLTLTFERAPPVTVTVTVRGSGGHAPAMDHTHMQ